MPIKGCDSNFEVNIFQTIKRNLCKVVVLFVATFKIWTFYLKLESQPLKEWLRHKHMVVSSLIHNTWTYSSKINVLLAIVTIQKVSIYTYLHLIKQNAALSNPTFCLLRVLRLWF